MILKIGIAWFVELLEKLFDTWVQFTGLDFLKNVFILFWFNYSFSSSVIGQIKGILEVSVLTKPSGFFANWNLARNFWTMTSNKKMEKHSKTNLENSCNQIKLSY